MTTELTREQFLADYKSAKNRMVHALEIWHSRHTSGSLSVIREFLMATLESERKSLDVSNNGLLGEQYQFAQPELDKLQRRITLLEQAAKLETPENQLAAIAWFENEATHLTGEINDYLIEKGQKLGINSEGVIRNGLPSRIIYFQQRRSKCLETAGVLRMIVNGTTPLDLAR